MNTKFGRVLLHLLPKCHQSPSAGNDTSSYYNPSIIVLAPDLQLNNSQIHGAFRNLTISRLICSVSLEPLGGHTQACSNL